MKKLALFIFLSLTFSLFAKPLDKTYKVVVLNDWKPYYFIGKDEKPKGYAIDLFEKIASSINLKYKYVIANNWKDAVLMLERKEVDIIPNIGIALKRGNYLNFTQSTDVFEISLFKNKSIKNIKTLKDKRVGVLLTNVCNKLINDKITDNKILFRSYHRSLAALSQNEIDVLCYPKPLVNQSIKELHIKNIEPFEKPLVVVKRAIGIVKGEEVLLDLFDKELLKIKGSGEYQKIYDKWFAVHKDIEIDYKHLLFSILIFIIRATCRFK